MTLLETITSAAAALDAGELRPSPMFPHLVDASAVLPRLQPELPSPPGGAPPLRRFSGWQPPESAADTAKFAERLVKKLRSKLKKNEKAFDRTEVIRVFDSVAGERWEAIVGGEAADVVIEACVRAGLWERLKGLILQGFFKGHIAYGLIDKLIESHRADLMCVIVRHVPSLRSRDLLAILKYFLNPTRNSREGMLKVRKEWESQGLLAVEKAREEGLGRKKMAFARAASVLLMMGHDGFTLSELCLHHVFSSLNAEGVVMSTAISRLSGAEVLSLVGYFTKWLEKYGRFPETVPCIGEKAPTGLVAHEWVPSLESVVNGLAMVLDEHFPYMVLNSEFHESLRALEKIVRQLTDAAGACHMLFNVIENLPLDKKSN